MIHACQINCSTNKVTRTKWRRPTWETMCAEQEFLTALPENGQTHRPFSEFPGVVCCTRRGTGAGLYTLATDDGIFAVAALILTGTDPDEESDFCRDFQDRLRDPQWRLPLPPMEVSVRPLVFSVAFRPEKCTDVAWNRHATTSVAFLYALGMAQIALATS